MRRLLSLAVVAVLSLVVTSCDGAPTEPAVPVARVDVTGAPADNVVLVGGTVQLQAVARDAAGAAINRGVTWSSTDPSVATVTSTGLVTAVRAGIAVISAEAGGEAGAVGLSVRVSVNVPPANATSAITADLLDNSLSLRIEPGATTASSITVGRGLILTNDTRILTGTAFVVGPVGTIFTTPLRAEVRVNLPAVPAAKRAGLRLFRVSPDGELTGLATSAVDLVRGVVTAPIGSAGTYVVIQPGDPTQVAAAEGNSRRVPVGTPVPGIGVVARDAQGNPVPGASIAFSIEGANGTIVGDTIALTGIDGRADLPGQWIVPAKGNSALRARVVGAPLLVQFTATAFAPAVAVRITSAPTSGLSGVQLDAPIPVELIDADGERAEVTQPVTLSLSGAGGTLEGVTTQTAVLGGAIFNAPRIIGAGTFRLVVSSEGLRPDTSAPISIGQRVAFMELRTAPAGAASGVPFTTQPVLELLDDARARVTAGDAQVTAFASGGGILLGTRTVRAVNGLATFTDLAVEGTGPVRLSFTTAGPVNAGFDELVVGPAPAGVRMLIGNLVANYQPGLQPTFPISVDLSNRGSADIRTLQVTVRFDPERFEFLRTFLGFYLDANRESGIITVDESDAAAGVLRFTAASPGPTVETFQLAAINVRVLPLASGASVETSVTAEVSATNAAGQPVTVRVLPLGITVFAP